MSTFAKQDPPMPPQQHQQAYVQPTSNNQPYPVAQQQQQQYPQHQQQQQQYPQQQQQSGAAPPHQYPQQPQNEPVYSNGQPVAAVPAEKVNWTTGTFSCFDDISSCCEVMWCASCHSSTQWNRTNNGKQGIEPLVCLAVFGGDCCLGGIGTPIIAVLLRQRLRTRYNLEGTDCNDIVCGCCCAGCVLCQNYREMCVRGEHPGGVVCAKTPYPGPVRVQ